MSQDSYTTMKFRPAKELARYMPSYDNIPGAEYYQRFISGYCIILPKGKRVYPEVYADYKRALIRHSADEVQEYSRAYFERAEQMELALEEAFELPNEYMLGVHEIYTNMAHAACLAHVEHQRLARAAVQSETKDKSSGISNYHLDLILTTSLEKSGLRFESDICRLLVEESRKGCKCLICVPPDHNDLLDNFTEEDKIRMSQLLKINTTAVNVYIPFRHTCYRAGGALAAPTRLHEAVERVLLDRK